MTQQFVCITDLFTVSIWRFSTMMSPPHTEKSTWQGSRKKDSKLQRNVLEPADRNSEEVSYTDKLLGHDLTNTLRLVWSKNLRRVQNREPKTEWLDKRIILQFETALDFLTSICSQTAVHHLVSLVISFNISHWSRYSTWDLDQFFK